MGRIIGRAQPRRLHHEEDTRHRIVASTGLAALAACAALAFGQAFAQGSLEKVLIPGPVIEGHAKYENNCRKCHIPFKRSEQDALCLACHKETAADVRQKQGFHGRLESQTCRSCHTEHKGRKVNIAPIDEQKFDHRQTDFMLHGAHSDPKVTCRSCHLARKKYREAPGACVGCHVKDDRHKGRLGSKCADCHTEKDWKETRFDHDKTRFSLRGKHTSLKCRSCHKTARYKEAPTTCVGCHRQDDKHKGRFGAKCGTCHTDRGWDVMQFNHDTDTRYPLRGRHRTLNCETCHRGNLYSEKLSTKCVACHRQDDKHKGTLGPSCDNCHTERTWTEARFDHSKTSFPLHGKHDAIKCKSCHKSAVFRDAPSTCIGCHRDDDQHKGALGERCGTCHSERSWRSSTFDHGKTRFPLLGGHFRAKCEACHRDPDFRGTSTNCYDCHKKDDVHDGQEGRSCGNCHDAETWKKARFDHGRARFPLLGRHFAVECRQCHTTQRYRDAKRECVACHGKDDVHKRRLGTRCEVCHNARAWKIWDFSHDRMTRFPLDGAHAKLDCYACHRRAVTDRATLPTGCASCHTLDDVHDGAFGRRCEKCHVTSSFKRIKQIVGVRERSTSFDEWYRESALQPEMAYSKPLGPRIYTLSTETRR